MKETAKIIDHLLTMVLLFSRGVFDHIDQTQTALLKNFPEYIVPALKYLKKAEDEGFKMTLAHSDWIDKMEKRKL